MSAWPGADGFQQAALLIDADNFHDAPSIDAAWAQLKARAGRVSVCRAYGNAVRLQALAALWRTLGVRLFPNLSLEKNTTDAALIADAVALHFQQGVRFFAIASGDTDFAPLAVRLREWGCEVWCFSMEGIVFQGVEAYYDRVVRFRPAPTPPPVPVPMVPVKPVAPPLVPEEIPTMPVVSVAPCAEKPLAPPLASPKPVPKSVPHPDLLLPDEVRRILEALPALREGPQHLSQAAATLRQKGILGKTVKSTRFLAPYAAYFKLSPPQQPNRLEFIEPLVKRGALPAVGAMPLQPPAPSKEDTQILRRIFAAFPGWLPDTVRQLSLMTILLHENGIELGSKPLDELFGAYPDFFKLQPDTGPALKVRLLKKSQGLAPV